MSYRTGRILILLCVVSVVLTAIFLIDFADVHWATVIVSSLFTLFALLYALVVGESSANLKQRVNIQDEQIAEMQEALVKAGLLEKRKNSRTRLEDILPEEGEIVGDDGELVFLDEQYK